MICFGGLNGTMRVISQERLLYLKERANQTYHTSSYFWGKSFAELPF